MKYPRMVPIKQHFKTNPIQDIPAEVRSELAGIQPHKIIAKGNSVAITAGSRGIANLAVIIAEIVRELKKVGAKPFIIPAMGSHGGATPEGQKKILEHYGITKKTMGVPVKSSLSVVQVGSTSEGIPVFLDRNASKADHIVVVNRVKPHTDFKGKFESGLMKMMAIGLGKQKGADHYHNVIVRRGHYPVFLSVAREILKRCPVAFGVAIVENQRHEICDLRLVTPNRLEDTEKKLLILAKQCLPTLPLGNIDFLIVDQMGKDVSGAGLDPNVIGTSSCKWGIRHPTPRISRIFVRRLSEASEGNGSGIGMVDVATARLVQAVDWEKTSINAFTAGCPEDCKVPMTLRSEEKAISVALNTIRPYTLDDLKIVHIKNTMDLDEMFLSSACLSHLKPEHRVVVESQHLRIHFNRAGDLEYRTL